MSDDKTTKKPVNNEGGKVIRLPTQAMKVADRPTAQKVPIEIARAARKDFKDWKKQFIMMINRGSQIEWWLDAGGQWAKRFILSPDLCEVVYEVQVKERIRAQYDHALKQCKKDGIVMPPKEEIEKIAMANLQQEFMSHTMRMMKSLVGAQQAAAAGPAPAKPAVAEEATPEEEAAAAANLKAMREQLVKGELGGSIDSAADKIKDELASRDDA